MTRFEKQLIGEILIEHYGVKESALASALEAQKKNGKKTGQILIERSGLTQEHLAMALARQFRETYIAKIPFEENELFHTLVSASYLRKNRSVPYQIRENRVFVAGSDALNIQVLDDLRVLFRGFEIVRVITTDREIDRLLSEFYGISESGSTDTIIEDLQEADLEVLSGELTESEDLLDMANEAPIIKLVNSIIKQAVESKASDIHIEPFDREMRVRFRIDGLLYQMFSPPKKFQSAILSRLKIMAALNIAENRLPQDGRIQIKLAGQDIDIRVSTFPVRNGERIVLRILNKSEMNFSLESLGLSAPLMNQFRNLAARSSGIVLVTGPTGSGKSTTLYSLLSEINNQNINILTVEDPVEYQLEGVGQMQVKPKIGLTFASGLRSILRQDPDVVMIGEIRDRETAEIAVQSALTGHRVFSTLHTNDAASGVTRLLDMGIEPFLVASSVNAFIAQRLIRRLCVKCRRPHKPGAAELRNMGITPKNSLKFFKAVGCDECHHTGYSGRVGIYELLEITEPVRRLIMRQAESGEINSVALEGGMVSLKMDGFAKVALGITTVEEVMRVL